MKKLLRYPFLCLLVLTMAVAAPFMWQEMGLLPERLFPAEAEVPQPELTAPEPPQEVVPPPVEKEPVPQPPVDTEVPPVFAENTDLPVHNSPISDQPPEEEEEPQGPVKPENPFEGALFIGDSRTVGIGKYAGITEADFFATTGMSIYSIFKETVKVGERAEKCTLETLLTETQYDRIYLMLGINELGYNFDRTVKTFGQAIAKLQELQPEAYIHLQANLHVTKEKSDSDTLYNNDNINKLNQALSPLADGERVFFLDPNVVFDDETGALGADLTWDGIHLLAKHYALWADFLRENTPA